MLSGRAKNVIVTDGGKNVYPEEIEDSFQLYYDVEQIMVRSYIMDEEHKSEGIESLIYPSDDMLARLGVERKDSANSDAVFAELKAIVDKVNKTLQPYARISKITVLQEPLEMTTTKKVKRNLLTAEKTAKAEKTPAKKTAKSAAKKTTAKPAAEKKTVAVKKTVKASAKTEVKKAPSKTAAKAASKPAVKPASKTQSKAPAKTAAKTQTKTAAKKAPAEKTKK